MLCPFCREKDTSVVDSIPAEDGTAIRRRRFCTCSGGQRFTTFERVQFRELTVIKKSGRRTVFDREKLVRSINISCRKRPVKPEQIELITNSIQRRLESSGEVDIPSHMIGQLVMESLSEIDQVAYVRFASVYRNFREEKDFVQFVDKLDVYKKR